MKKIEAIIRPTKLEDIKDELSRFGIHGLTISQVMGCGRQKGLKEIYRGAEYSINLIPKIKVEIVIRDKYVNDIIGIFEKIARTGEVGDGKIFVYNIEDAVRIRTDERGEDAI